ncbi:hypothetical protein KY366_03300 [Candidatus Woesearchaeota archaeon]|nr:hypothetical protein [Candidatus Woesearchaeota archaeon]
MIRKIILITLILTLLLAVGCQKAERPAEGQETSKTTGETSIAGTEKTSEISIESDVADIGSLNEELNMEDLEGLESELDEIEW